MKDFYIRLVFGLITIAVISLVADMFSIEWLQGGGVSRNLFVIGAALFAGYGGLYVVKSFQKQKG